MCFIAVCQNLPVIEEVLMISDIRFFIRPDIFFVYFFRLQRYNFFILSPNIF